MSPAPRPVSTLPAAEVARFPVDRAGDAQLVAAAAKGDRRAMAEVWDRHSDFVRGVLHGALGRDHAIEDLTQEVFLAFVRSAATVADGSKLRGFLAGVAVRLAAMEIRRRKVRRWLVLSPTGELRVVDYKTGGAPRERPPRSVPRRTRAGRGDEARRAALRVDREPRQPRRIHRRGHPRVARRPRARAERRARRQGRR